MVALTPSVGGGPVAWAGGTLSGNDALVVAHVNSSSRMARPQPGRQRDACQVWQIALPGHDTAAGMARESVRKALSAWELAHLEETALVVVTELVTNALQHARADSPELRVAAEHGLLRIEVYDSDPRPPGLCEPLSLDETGRGLFLVDALAHRWGFRECGPGKAVWAELDADCAAYDVDCGGSPTSREQQA
jgi:Histidine kinase-like ATPase domain